MSKIVGIYVIENITNGKKYFGQSVDVMKRIYNHRFQLRSHIHSNTHLQGAWDKYGETAFSFDVFMETSVDRLDQIENLLIRKYKTMNPRFGYNMASGGNENRKVRPESLEKMSKSHLGKRLSDETRKRMSKSKMGMHMGGCRTQEQKDHLSKLFSGQKVSSEVKEKITAALISRPKMLGATSRFRGVHFCKRHKKWDSRIKYKGNLYLLGLYRDEIDAALAYNKFVLEKGFPHPLNEIKEMFSC